MKLITHLTFAGECEAAFHLYADLLDGTITFLAHYGETSQPSSTPTSDKVFHATLRISDFTLTGVDLPPDTYKPPQGFAVQLNLRDPARADTIYTALKEGGTVHLPLQPTPWAQAYSALTDRFGIPWEINCGPDA